MFWLGVALFTIHSEAHNGLTSTELIVKSAEVGNEYWAWNLSQVYEKGYFGIEASAELAQKWQNKVNDRSDLDFYLKPGYF